MKIKILNLLLFFLLVSRINSQENPPCTDCWNVPWVTKTDIISFPITNCPNCTLVVEYWYRVITDTCRDYATYIGTKDIQIKEVWGTPGCNLCFSLQQKYQIAKDSLLLNNALTQKPRPSLDTLWRVFQTSCWGEWWDVFDQKYKIRGCLPNNICCWELYGVYSTNNNVDSVSKLKVIIQAPMWDSCNKWPTPCWFVCDTAYSPPPPPDLMSIQGYNSNFYSQILPNPNNGNFELEFINDYEETDEISIRFHDINGKLIYEMSNIIPLKGQKLKLNLEQLHTGKYYYKITHKNRVIDNGTLLITK